MASSIFHKIEARHREERGYRMMICLDAETLDELMELAEVELIRKLDSIKRSESFSDLKKNVDDFVFHWEDTSSTKIFIEIENKLPEHKLKQQRVEL